MSDKTGEIGRDIIGVIAFAIVATFAALVLSAAFWLALVVVPGWLAWTIYKYRKTRPAELEREAHEHLSLLHLQARADNGLSFKEFAHAVFSQLPVVPTQDVYDDVMVELYHAHPFTVPPPPPVARSMAGARYQQLLHDRGSPDAAVNLVVEALSDFMSRLPKQTGTGIRFEAHLRDLANGELVAALLFPFFATNENPPFAPIRRQLERNLEAIGGDKFVSPRDYAGKENIATAYLKGTPLILLFEQRVPIVIPDAARIEHMHIMAGSGHGKTQTLQYLIHRDLEDVAKGNKTVIVLDSQGQMIPHISRLSDFSEGLAGRLVLIDPADTRYPFALPLFDIPETSNEALRAQYRATAVSLLTYVFAGLLGASITSYQSGLLGNAIRACLVIPKANIFTLQEVIRDATPFKDHFAQLPKAAQDFFTHEYPNETYKGTRRELGSKLAIVFENEEFTRLFSHEKATFHMYDEMAAGTVILIDAARHHLQDGSATFGRFFIALVLQAAYRRANDKDRVPVHFYIDEAHEYIDDRIEKMLDQARKASVGLTLAHHRLSQLKDVKDAVLSNTIIKLAGRLQHDDISKMAKEMEADEDQFRHLQKLEFLLSVKPNPAVRVRIPSLVVENSPHMSEAQWTRVRADIRARYSPAKPEPEVSAPKEMTEEEEPLASDATSPATEWDE